MDADFPVSSPGARPSLHVLRVVLPAAPLPLVLRRDRPVPDPLDAIDPADVLRYVGAARRTRRGPLVAQFEGPGDPLASPGHLLRALALLRDHDPDVMPSIVIDGPLLAEYLDELLDLCIHHVVLRMDAFSVRTAWRVYGRIQYRGELIVGPDAGRLVLEEGRRAVRLLAAHRIPTAIRFTAIPTVNLRDLPAIAAFAAGEGVERIDIVPHVPVARAPLAKVGAPSAGELEMCREIVAGAYAAALLGGDGADLPRAPGALAWFADGRLDDIPLGELDRVDVMSLLPDPLRDSAPEGEILPPRKSVVVGVATTDGAFVDRSLVDASHLQVYAVTPEGIRWLGTRALPSGILRRRDGVGVPSEFLEAVAGCRAIVATRFTRKAAILLDAVGVRPHMAGGHVDEILDRVARGTLSTRSARDPARRRLTRSCSRSAPSRARRGRSRGAPSYAPPGNSQRSTPASGALRVRRIQRTSFDIAWGNTSLNVAANFGPKPR